MYGLMLVASLLLLGCPERKASCPEGTVLDYEEDPCCYGEDGTFMHRCMTDQECKKDEDCPDARGSFKGARSDARCVPTLEQIPSPDGRRFCAYAHLVKWYIPK